MILTFFEVIETCFTGNILFILGNILCAHENVISAIIGYMSYNVNEVILIDSVQTFSIFTSKCLLDLSAIGRSMLESPSIILSVLFLVL